MHSEAIADQAVLRSAGTYLRKRGPQVLPGALAPGHSGSWARGGTRPPDDLQTPRDGVRARPRTYVSRARGGGEDVGVDLTTIASGTLARARSGGGGGQVIPRRECRWGRQKPMGVGFRCRAPRPCSPSLLPVSSIPRCPMPCLGADEAIQRNGPPGPRTRDGKWQLLFTLALPVPFRAAPPPNCAGQPASQPLPP